MGADRPTDEDIQDALASRIREQVRTQIPGVVVTYDPATARAKVQPTRMIKRLGGPPVLLPPIPAAPVLWQRFGGMVSVGRLNPGDLVLLSVCDRELDSFMRQGPLPADPKSARMHSLTDAVVLVGMPSDARPLPATAGLGGTEWHLGREDGTAAVRMPLAPLPPLVMLEGPEVGGIRLGAEATEGALRGTAVAAACNVATGTSLAGVLTAVPNASDPATVIALANANKTAILGLMAVLTAALSTKVLVE